MYYYDFDGNGKKEQIVTYYQAGKKIPLAGIEEIEKKLPGLKKKFLYAGDFAKASIDDIFSHEKLSRADSFTANSFANVLMMNKGASQFESTDLPWQAQLSTLRDAVVVNANGDSLPDLLLFGNCKMGGALGSFESCTKPIQHLLGLAIHLSRIFYEPKTSQF